MCLMPSKSLVPRVNLCASVTVRHRNRLHMHQFIFSWERKLESTHTQLVYILVNIYILRSPQKSIFEVKYIY